MINRTYVDANTEQMELEPPDDRAEPADNADHVATSYDGSTVVTRILRLSSWGPLLMNLGYHTGTQFFVNMRPNLERAQRRMVFKALELLDVQSGQRMLDVACGRGKSSFITHCLHTDATVVGMDLLEHNIQIAQTVFDNTPNLSYRVGNAMDIPFPDNSFERSMCIEAAFHFPDRSCFLREAYRVLRPGGRLVVIDFAWNTEAERAHRDDPDIRIVRDTWQWDDLFSIEQYRRVAEDAGFRVRSSDDWSRHVTRPFQRKFNCLCMVGRTPWMRRLLIRRNPMYASLTDDDWATAQRVAKAHERAQQISKYMAFVFDKPS